MSGPSVYRVMQDYLYAILERYGEHEMRAVAAAVTWRMGEGGTPRQFMQAITDEVLERHPSDASILQPIQDALLGHDHVEPPGESLWQDVPASRFGDFDK